MTTTEVEILLCQVCGEERGVTVVQFRHGDTEPNTWATHALRACCDEHSGEFYWHDFDDGQPEPMTRREALRHKILKRMLDPNGYHHVPFSTQKLAKIAGVPVLVHPELLLKAYEEELAKA